jgi:hypothetical protein
MGFYARDMILGKVNTLVFIGRITHDDTNDTIDSRAVGCLSAEYKNGWLHFKEPAFLN